MDRIALRTRRRRAPPRPAGASRLGISGALALLLLSSLGVAGLVAGHVVVQGSAPTTAQGVGSIFAFADAPNYARASGLGIITDTYPNAAQASVSVSLTGFAGSSGSYALDTLEVRNIPRTTVAWTLELDVSVPLVASGANAVWVSYCTRAPTNIPASGTPLSSGTDASGNPWALFAPTCTGRGAVESNLDLTLAGAGTPIVVAANRAPGTVDLYVSFMWAVGSTGVTTTTPATVTLSYQA